MIFGNISITNLLGLLILASLLWLLIWAGKRFIPMVVHLRRNERSFRVWTLRIETLAWVSFALFALYRLLLESPGYVAIILAIVLIIGRELWRDFIPGLLFRLQGIADPGDQMLFEEDICRVESIGVRYLKLKTAEGNILLIPYHRLNEITFTQTIQKGKTNDYSFSVIYISDDKDLAISTLQRHLLESPWSIPSKSLRIKAENDNSYRITIAAIDEQVANRLRKNLLERIREQSS